MIDIKATITVSGKSNLNTHYLEGTWTIESCWDDDASARVVHLEVAALSTEAWCNEPCPAVVFDQDTDFIVKADGSSLEDQFLDLTRNLFSCWKTGITPWFLLP